MTLSSSPKRHTFQAQSSVKKLAENPNDQSAIDMLEWIDEMKASVAAIESDPGWQENNMEYDLRTTEWILEKVRADEVYAQHLYAAMCNRDFTKNAVWPLLQEERWSCSWRHAGGIIADMREQGDYIDWYCSGMVGNEITPAEFDDLSVENQMHYLKIRAFVCESVATDEIRTDLLKLGWIVLDDDI